MAKRAKPACQVAGLVLICSLLTFGVAMAGPPYRTDDPEPVDYQHWEYYAFTTGTHINGDTSGIGPAAEFNYGLIPNGQFHIVVPAAFDVPVACQDNSGMATQSLVSNTASLKRTRTVPGRKLAYFRWSNCRLEIKIRA
jgi:hypothetical protein